MTKPDLFHCKQIRPRSAATSLMQRLIRLYSVCSISESTAYCHLLLHSRYYEMLYWKCSNWSRSTLFEMKYVRFCHDMAHIICLTNVTIMNAIGNFPSRLAPNYFERQMARQQLHLRSCNWLEVEVSGVQIYSLKFLVIYFI